MNVRVTVFQHLSAHLKKRRGELVQRWRASVLADPGLTTGTALPRAQLSDHVPAALIAFERRLLCMAEDGAECSSDATIEAANAHGKHRWQQGYDLREVVRELGHLNRVMVAEIDAFAVETQAPPDTMSDARCAWAVSYAAGIEQSTHQFYQLRQVEAAGHVLDLENALEEITEFDRQRATLWEQLAHDLRGNVGVVAAATRALRLKSAPDDPRERFTQMLDRNVESLRHLLDDVTSLTRLQAGTELRQLADFDVSGLLEPMCDGLQSLALQRGLYLRTQRPPEPLVVQGDAVKVRRLAQNLIINALKYTQEGGVEVRWAACERTDGLRWVLTVADTGPGIHAGPGTPLASALREATEVAHQHDMPAPDHPAAIAPDPRPMRQSAGEGIGLSIVKRLAELLDATVELESDPATGTVFKILLPKRYQVSQGSQGPDKG
ncbi:histidine kinase [Xylophilus sp. Kf1]|nr:histidine kinase [Xylophilus sp. Kf1]